MEGRAASAVSATEPLQGTAPGGEVVSGVGTTPGPRVFNPDHP